LVLHPARRLAPSYGVYGYSPPLVCLFSDWLHHLSRARWREIFRIHRLDRGRLLSDPCLARSTGLCDAAVGRFDAHTGFPSPMGPAQADRALDDPNLAVRVGYWSSRLLDALQMVPAAGALSAVSSAVLSGLSDATHNFSTCTEDIARYSDEPANHSDVKILRSTAI
jgi:hypothetical protein